LQMCCPCRYNVFEYCGENVFGDVLSLRRQRLWGCAIFAETTSLGMCRFCGDNDFADVLSLWRWPLCHDEFFVDVLSLQRWPLCRDADGVFSHVWSLQFHLKEMMSHDVKSVVYCLTIFCICLFAWCCSGNSVYLNFVSLNQSWLEEAGVKF
jgi:hypothetical protein